MSRPVLKGCLRSLPPLVRPRYREWFPWSVWSILLVLAVALALAVIL